MTDSETTYIHAERPQISDARRKKKASQFELVVKSLARFNTQFKVKERFKL